MKIVKVTIRQSFKKSDNKKNGKDAAQ